MTAEPSVEALLTADEPLSRHTYLRVGGPAQYFATPSDRRQLGRIAAWAHASGLPLHVLGGGSNVLVADEGVTGVVVSLRDACGAYEFDGKRVIVGAGVMLPALARAAAERGLGGLEFAVGIPGAVGGALQSNAGIGDGRAIGALVRNVEVLDGDALRVLERDEVVFEYRTSSLRHSGLIVLSATLELNERPAAEIEAEMRELLAARAATQPTAGPNAGSIFRNPEGDYAGRVIEAAGLKGRAAGAASVSELHANFIVHDGSATAADVVALMSEVQQAVLERFELWLEPEVEWWGSAERPAPWHGRPAG
ncbi:MAG: UDP-N-acetylmuramate dehydrogenase [Dehalococcoidia bacterium]|jgi:UDP-N-acetylmuramate dehydrogenase|nr:UDP-N-acetylmuramate dehydrogenase [Dehalococcoidia bacterium]